MKYSLESLRMGIRGMREADYGLVYDSMINSLHKGNPQNKCVRMGAFKAHIRDMLDTHIHQFEKTVVCSADDPNIIHGWALADNGRLVYCYVPLSWRGKGVASALLDCMLIESYATWTFSFRPIAEKRNLAFIPPFIKPFTK